MIQYSSRCCFTRAYCCVRIIRLLYYHPAINEVRVMMILLSSYSYVVIHVLFKTEYCCTSYFVVLTYFEVQKYSSTLSQQQHEVETIPYRKGPHHHIHLRVIHPKRSVYIHTTHRSNRMRADKSVHYCCMEVFRQLAPSYRGGYHHPLWLMLALL